MNIMKIIQFFIIYIVYHQHNKTIVGRMKISKDIQTDSECFRLMSGSFNKTISPLLLRLNL